MFGRFEEEGGQELWILSLRCLNHKVFVLYPATSTAMAVMMAVVMVGHLFSYDLGVFDYITSWVVRSIAQLLAN